MQFPVFVELEGAACLVVGGGAVAVRKAATLAEFGAKVVVVAPQVADELKRGPYEVRERPFAAGDLEGAFLVVAATGDPVTNARVARLCRDRGVPVNAVDDPKNCTFAFGALFRKGPVVAAVSSGGRCPVAAQMVRDRLAGIVSDGFAAKVGRLGEAREELKRRFPDLGERKRFYEKELERG